MKLPRIIFALSVVVLLGVVYITFSLHPSERSSRLALLLLGIASIALVGSSMLLFRGYRSKVKAEEDARYWRHKSALEEKIRRSEERYRTMVETAHDIVWTLDTQGNFTFINKRGEEFSGYKASEWMGKSFVPLIHPEDLAKVQQVFVETLTGKPLSYEVRVYAQDGKILTLSVNTIPLYEGNEVVGTVSFGRDITETKRAEEALRFERDKAISIFAAMEDGVYIVNTQYDIEYLNPTLLKEFGPIEGRKCYEYFHDRKEVCPWCPNQDVFAGNTVRWEWYSFKNQKTYDLLDVPLRNPDGSISKLEIFRDITDRKLAEERIAKVNECLLRFGKDPLGNINLLTALCGELFGATAALYNRLDKGKLCSWGTWNMPPDYNPVDNPEGHICYDVISKGGEEVIVVRNLLHSPYAETDPNVIPGQLQTYVGKAVKFAEAFIGALCVVFQKDFVPSEEDKRLMGIIASAIGVEEGRKRGEEELARRISELERFNRVAVGRELKMIELKERIRQLEAERGTHP